jgi:ABC-type xylose transport system substrate-binding protein
VKWLPNFISVSGHEATALCNVVQITVKIVILKMSDSPEISVLVASLKKEHLQVWKYIRCAQWFNDDLDFYSLKTWICA